MTANGRNADVKDELEAVPSRLVCFGRMPLAEAQQRRAAGKESIREIARSYNVHNSTISRLAA
jgi:hypothetical protein